MRLCRAAFNRSADRSKASDAGRPADLEFLDSRNSVAKGAVNQPWNLLDFLGFSRPNRDFSRAYEENSETLFSCALVRSSEAPGGLVDALSLLGPARRRLSHDRLIRTIYTGF